MPYGKSNKSIQDSAFKLKSGNTTPFKQMGASPLKQGEHNLKSYQAFQKKVHTTHIKVPKSSMPKNFNMTGSSKAGKFIKWAGKIGKFLGGKTLGVAGMMMATSSKADQPKKGKGKVEYPGGKIDFTK